MVQALKKEFPQVAFVIADVDTGEGRELMAQYGVSGVPTFFTLAASGQVQRRLLGAVTEAALKQVLADLTSAQ